MGERWSSARDAISSIADRRPDAAILLDFDGTLSPIAPWPEEARPAPGAAALLESLASAYRTVAVVSGRRASDVSSKLGADVRYVGLYGLEDDAGRGEADAGAERIERMLPDLRRAAAYVPGSRVEPKGVQVAVHYRAAPDLEAAERVLRERLGTLARKTGMTLLEGKRVFELAPAGGPTKGDVVTRVGAEDGLRALLYAGDDVADLEAFAAVDRLAASGLHGLKIAVRSAETPEEVIRSADVAVDAPEALLELLRGLLPSAAPGP